MHLLSRPGLIRVLAFLVSGLICGVIFGAAFGWLASWFQMGPGPVQGVLESAPWFGAVGLLGGFLLGIEPSGQNR